MDTTDKNSTSQEKKEYKTFRFVDYKVYQESKKWFQEVLSLQGVLEDYSNLWNQLKYNTTSVVMNIAAASTQLPGDAKRYLSYSITASNKAVACLDIACDLQVLTPEEFQTLAQGFRGVIIQLKSFIKALGNRSPAETSKEAQTEDQKTEP